MNEEIMNGEVMDESVPCEGTEPCEESSDGVSLLAVGAVMIVAAGVGAIGALLYKNRAKLEERKIKRWEKKGYVIYKPETPREVEVSEDCEESKE